MQEITTKAVVLSRANVGEANSLLTLYTQELGLVRAVARSTQSLKSKLSAHLEPLTLSNVRLVRKNQFTITDALVEKNFLTLIQSSDLGQDKKLHRLQELLNIFALIQETASPEQPDQELWELLENGKVFSKEILKVIGLDPDHAICNQCESARPTHFLIKEGYYLCSSCLNQPNRDKLMLK